MPRGGAPADDPITLAALGGLAYVAIMVTHEAVGHGIGCVIAESAEQRNQVTRKLGAFKTSMLQDVEARRAVEIDVLLSAPREIGNALGMSTPYLDALLGLARLQAKTLGLYPS